MTLHIVQAVQFLLATARHSASAGHSTVVHCMVVHCIVVAGRSGVDTFHALSIEN